MIPINNSDTAWLIVADFNQENGKFHEELREDVLNPMHEYWEYESVFGGNGDVGDGDSIVGYEDYFNDNFVGDRDGDIYHGMHHSGDIYHGMHHSAFIGECVGGCLYGSC